MRSFGDVFKPSPHSKTSEEEEKLFSLHLSEIQTFLALAKLCFKGQYSHLLITTQYTKEQLKQFKKTNNTYLFKKCLALHKNNFEKCSEDKEERNEIIVYFMNLKLVKEKK